jgi:hypothetical protein
VESSERQKAESRKQKAEALGYAWAFSLWGDSNWNKLFCTSDLYSVDGVLYESEHNQRISEFPRRWSVAIGAACGDLSGRRRIAFEVSDPHDRRGRTAKAILPDLK